MEEVFPFNKSLKGTYYQRGAAAIPAKSKFDPATMPTDCRAEDKYRHSHYFAEKDPRHCWKESEMREEKKKEYLAKLPRKTAMAKAVEKDKQRVKLAPEDKLYNKLIQHEMEFSPVVDYWERNGAEYARWKEEPLDEYRRSTEERFGMNFSPARRIMFGDLEVQKKIGPGASFTAKVVHINTPLDFYVIPVNAQCDGDLVDQIFTNRPNNEEYSYLMKRRERGDVQCEAVADGLNFHTRQFPAVPGLTDSTDPGAAPPKYPSFPRLGEKDKLFYYCKPGYLDLHRREEASEDIQENVLAKKVADAWRVDYYIKEIMNHDIHERMHFIVTNHYAQKPLKVEKQKQILEDLRKHATDAFFPSKTRTGLFEIFQELSSFIDNQVKDSYEGSWELEEFPLNLLQYKSKDGYVINEIVAVFVEFEMLPEEKVLYGLKEDSGTRTGWLRGRIIDIDGDKEIYVDFKKYVVHLIDYGARIVVRDQFVLRLPQQFTKYPPMAYKCRLENVGGYYSDVDFFYPDEMTPFLDLVKNKLLRVNVSCLDCNIEELEVLAVFLTLENAEIFTDVAEELEQKRLLKTKCVFHHELDEKLRVDYGLTRQELSTFAAFRANNPHMVATADAGNPEEEKEDVRKKANQVQTAFCLKRQPEHMIDWKLGGCLQEKPDTYPAWNIQWSKSGADPADIERYHRTLYFKPEPLITPRETEEDREKRLKAFAESMPWFKEAMRRRRRREEEAEAQRQRQLHPQPGAIDLLQGRYYFEWQEAQLEKQKKYE